MKNLIKPYSTFNTKYNNQLHESMFFGNSVNISRFDQQKYSIFEKLIERQLSFFWRPEEIDLSKDRIDFQKFNEKEKHIFLSNLQYQILLDSIQGRSPNISLLTIVSLPELETWIETWSFSETIHARSYTHIVRSLINDPGIVFDNIIHNKNIRDRAQDISYYYDKLIKYSMMVNVYNNSANNFININVFNLKKYLYLTLHAINALEAIRFYISFACTFAFSEQKKLEGCGKIIKLIARDESLHLTGTQHIINIILNGQDGDEELTTIAKYYSKEAKMIFINAVEQEKNWAKYLFKKGAILGLNEELLCQYIDYLAKDRMQAVGLDVNDINAPKNNPLPWINSYLNSDNVQVAPQEVEISSYLVGQIDNNIAQEDFSNFKL